ncbi:immunoglobulin kappa light chain-like [Carcharodon carcharias]|uniref:immunoglobulin kappa light chain-like n=1 Tax=Carcharodon carcharias TaxID=13397 RepID=UPI001B7E6EBE|nr:immunoglobulin kappa light chain-like [Carcharodon carcharias]
MTAKVGETVKLTCHCIYELESVSRHFWYKQRVGEAPKLIDSQSCQGDNCKFISKKGHSENVLILEIRNAHMNDSDFYNCADKDVYEAIQNCPTLLVGDSSNNKASVRVFVPPGELHLRETVPLVYLVSGVSSNQIVIFWNISGLVTEGPSDPDTMEAGGTYSIRNHVMVSRETWKTGGVCTCIVQLGSPGKYWMKSVSFPKATVAGAGELAICSFYFIRL